MSYQVIARKYRPQKFAEVIGQDHVTRTLTNALSMGRIHHAYLFAGARGVGKTTVARILAKALNCENGSKSEPCCECVQCLDIANGSSLDVQEIDGASNTGVDDVREIRERARYLPSSAKYKIYIIDEVHMLSTSAFNALLKILEEPPPHVVFVFATTESQKIPATILSRCQRYDFRRIPNCMIAESLKNIANSEGITIDDTALDLISHEAGGSLRDGQSLFDQAIAFAGKNIDAKILENLLGFLDHRTTMDLLEAITSKDAKKSLELLDNIYQTGSDLIQLATSLLKMFRNMLIIKVAGETKHVLGTSKAEAQQIASLAEKLSTEEIEHMFQIWYGGTEQLIRSQFPKMVMEVLVIRLCNVTPVAQISELIAKIDNLVAQQTGSETNMQNVLSASNAAHKELPDTSQPGNSWEEFMRWLVNERPQIASVFGHSKVVSFNGNSVELQFEASIYSEMLAEPDRKKQIDEMILKFFKRSVSIVIRTNSAKKEKKANDHKKQITKEALESQLVRDAANIFDAHVHEVKTK